MNVPTQKNNTYILTVSVAYCIDYPTWGGGKLSLDGCETRGEGVNKLPKFYGRY